MPAKPRASLLSTASISAEGINTMTRRWSPSLIHMLNCLSRAWKMPRPCGQYSWYPQAACLWSRPRKRKWSAMSAFSSSSVMLACSMTRPFRSSSSFSTALLTRFRTSMRLSAEPFGFIMYGAPRLRARRMRVEATRARASGVKWTERFSGLRSVC